MILSNFMRRFPRLICFLFLVHLSIPLGADTANDFLKAYFLIQEADKTAKDGKNTEAIEKYSAALKTLREIKKTDPQWNPSVLDYRSQYCIDNILKAGGKIEPEGSPTPEILTPVAVPIPSAAVTDSLPKTTPEPNRALEQISRLEQLLKNAHEELARLQGEKAGLVERLAKIEGDLKSNQSAGDERFQVLFQENGHFKQKIFDVEARIKDALSQPRDLESLKAELIKAQDAILEIQEENRSLKNENELLRKDLEEVRIQLKASMEAPGKAARENLQILQTENILLRSVMDRQFQEDAKRTFARKSLEQELQKLASQAGTLQSQIGSQIEILQTPLTPLSAQEAKLLKVKQEAIATVVEAEPQPSKPETTNVQPSKSMTTDASPILVKAESVHEIEGHIALIDISKNFVIIDFQNGKMPSLNSELGVYRDHRSVGRIRITKPVNPPMASADILKGTLSRGDFVY